MEQAAYAKWLRYYLDFCHKYHFPPQQRGSLAPFLQKLEEKNQTKAQRQQASDGITRYYELLRSTASPSDGPPPQTVSPPGKIPDGSSHPALLSDREANASPPVSPPEETHEGPSHRPLLSVHEASASLKASSPFSRSQGKAHSEPSTRIDSSSTSVHTSTGVSWTEPYARLAQEIQLRHYSPKTLKSYKQWMQHFQTFTRSKDPLLLSSVDVKEFLTFLAVTKKVSASTQNQAFNALLFFYRHVLNKEFGKIEGVVRAKRKPYIPVVLSREEIDAILAPLPLPYNLVVKLLYGCGLRLSECLHLPHDRVIDGQSLSDVHINKKA
ncbi:MAG: phage integrase N-terminal SAM-like domain-containing protein [Nitrospinae bacterium]|nr:phage integrase N-terminal SAM-like domain-containing protein [Nitrospinota bacterium]